MMIHELLELYSYTVYVLGYILLAYILIKNFQTFVSFQNREFDEYFCKMPPKKRSKRKGSQERERISTQVQARGLSWTC